MWGIYNLRLAAFAASRTDWNANWDAPDVLRFPDEQAANEYLAEYGDLFDSACLASGFPRRDNGDPIRFAERGPANTFRTYNPTRS